MWPVPYLRGVRPRTSNATLPLHSHPYFSLHGITLTGFYQPISEKTSNRLELVPRLDQTPPVVRVTVHGDATGTITRHGTMMKEKIKSGSWVVMNPQDLITVGEDEDTTYSLVVPANFTSLNNYWNAVLAMVSTFDTQSIPSLSQLRKTREDMLTGRRVVPPLRPVGDNAPPLPSFAHAMDEFAQLLPTGSLVLWKWAGAGFSSVLFMTVVSPTKDIVLYLPETDLRRQVIIAVETLKDFERTVRTFFPLIDYRSVPGHIVLCKYHAAEKPNNHTPAPMPTPTGVGIGDGNPSSLGKKRARISTPADSTPNKKLAPIAPKPLVPPTLPTQPPLNFPASARCDICRNHNVQSLLCKHSFCNSCLNLVCVEKCPMPDCDEPIPDELRQAASKKNNDDVSTPAMQTCPQCHLTAPNPSATPYLFQCNACDITFCLKCRKPMHSGQTCEQAAGEDTTTQPLLTPA